MQTDGNDQKPIVSTTFSLRSAKERTSAPPALWLLGTAAQAVLTVGAAWWKVPVTDPKLGSAAAERGS